MEIKFLYQKNCSVTFSWFRILLWIEFRIYRKFLYKNTSYISYVNNFVKILKIAPYIF